MDEKSASEIWKDQIKASSKKNLNFFSSPGLGESWGVFEQKILWQATDKYQQTEALGFALSGKMHDEDKAEGGWVVYKHGGNYWSYLLAYKALLA